MSYSRLRYTDAESESSSSRETWLSMTFRRVRDKISDMKAGAISIPPDEGDEPNPMTSRRSMRRMKHWLACLCLAAVLGLVWAYSRGHVFFPLPSQKTQYVEPHPCRAPLPPLFVADPPAADHPEIVSAAQKLEREFDYWFKADEAFDSISLGVVTSNGLVYEGYWGPKRANETDISKQGHVDGHTIYRLASISKLFTSLETFILRDKGALNLDDPVKKFLPQISFDPDDEPITFRQLMSHMSGLGRDWPPGDASKAWPNSLDGRGPPIFNGLPFPSNEQFFESLRKNTAVMSPYTLPEYSNTGFALLGLANVAANEAFEGKKAPSTHAELIQRDIFDPLGLNGSAFLATETIKQNVAVATIETDEPNQDFLDAMNPAGGQFSSMYDLAKLMQTFIDPTRSESLLRPYTVREWMRPIHTFWDDYSKIGMLWEISSVIDSFGRKTDLYEKAGELGGYHSLFTINPSSSFGLILLTTGPESKTRTAMDLAVKHFQPVFDALLEQKARTAFAGAWTSSDRTKDSLTIDIDAGSMYVTEYILNGTDVLDILPRNPNIKMLPLWRTRGDEYRVVPTSAGGFPGCFTPWVMMDSFGYVNGVSVNALQFMHDDETNERSVFLPAVNMRLKRDVGCAH